MAERFCVTCKHHAPGPVHRCYHPSLSTLDMVTGERQPVGCKHQRDDWTGQQILYAQHMGHARCGPEGKFWEAKPEGLYGHGRPTDQQASDFVKAYWEDRGWKGE